MANGTASPISDRPLLGTSREFRHLRRLPRRLEPKAPTWGHPFPPPEWYTLRGTTRACDFNPFGAADYSKLHQTNGNQMYLTRRSERPFVRLTSLGPRVAAGLPGRNSPRREMRTGYGERDDALVCSSALAASRKDAVRPGHFSSPTPCRCRQNAPLLALLGAHARPVRPRLRRKSRSNDLRGFTSRREQIFRHTVPHVEGFVAQHRLKREMAPYGGHGPEERIAQLRVAAARERWNTIPGDRASCSWSRGGRRWSEKKKTFKPPPSLWFERHD